MLAKFNKLDVAESVTESLSLESQKDIKVICWGWTAFSRKEKYVSVVQKREAVVTQLLPFAVGIERLLCRSLIFNTEF